MSIRQPIATTIHTNDFKDKAYSFTLESVLNSESVPGKVVISASTGYLLTTSSNKQPKREQTLEHSRQSDGSWMAFSVVTLLFNGDAPINGTVVIQNSHAEAVKLLITTEPISTTAPIATEQPKTPILTVSQPILTFASTSPDRPSFLLLTVTQEHSDEPVTLSSESPEYFQVATDNHPNFTSTLTLNPSPLGTYVHVRYLAPKTGLHKSELTVHSQYEELVIPLKGRTKSLMNKVFNSTTLGALAVVVASSLAYVGYDNRCTLFPSLCQKTIVRTPINRASAPAPALAPEPTLTNQVKPLSEKPKRNQAQRDKARVNDTSEYTEETEETEATPAPTEPADTSNTQPVPYAINRPQSVNTFRRIVHNSRIRSSSDDKELNNAVSSQPYQRTNVAPSTEVSDLERLLNQAKFNQPN